MRDRRAELIRIDSLGVAHPIGNIAGQRMRSRAGTYRLLPAPEHVVFMRFTGEDGRRDAGDGAVVRLAGEVTAPGTLCDVLALLGQTGWRGELVVLDGEHVRSVFFDQGNVLGATTSVDAERLGSVLYRYGVITAEVRERILNATSAGRRFGEAAIDLGLLAQDQIYAYIGKQVAEIVFAILTIGDGTFFFLEGFDDARLVSRHAVSATNLVMEAVTRMDEMRFFRQKIPSADHVPARNEGRSKAPDEFEKVYRVVDGQASVGDVGRRTGLGEFETTRALYALLQSQHVVIHPPRASGGPTGLVTTANAALRAIFDAANSGGVSAELRANLASFAVGAGVYDILFRNAGPDDAGALDAEVVAENALIVASGADATHVLKQMLHEYVSFALFSAGTALGAEAETELNRACSSALSGLRPKG